MIGSHGLGVIALSGERVFGAGVREDVPGMGDKELVAA